MTTPVRAVEVGPNKYEFPMQCNGTEPTEFIGVNEMTTPSESKHTPGPWSATEAMYSDHIGNYRMIVGSGEIVAHVWPTGNANEKCDTPLIAAAPDLLAALKGVLRVADRATLEFDAARAAIAKAEGRS
jgi:hypothetical protein